MSAGRAVHRGFHAEAFDGFGEDANRFRRVGFRGGDGFFEREINFRQIISVGDVQNIPAESADAVECRIHAERIRRDTTRKLGIIVGNDHHEWI